jgi:hypothetical protein
MSAKTYIMSTPITMDNIDSPEVVKVLAHVDDIVKASEYLAKAALFEEMTIEDVLPLITRLAEKKLMAMKAQQS